MITNTSFRR